MFSKLIAGMFGLVLLGGALPSVAQVAPVPPVYGRRHIYSETANPKADIAAALKQARLEHKRVLLDFGGDWCGDCQVLDIYMHREPNQTLLTKNFVLVHVFIDAMMAQDDKNIQLGAAYGVPITKGVPALAVLNPYGKILYSQKTGEFEDMRHMDPQSVNEFLTRWKG